MKRQWDIEELIEHFTLVTEDEELLANKTGATRLGFALLLKCFQLEGKFPAAKHEIPKDVVNYIAHQLKLEASLFGFQERAQDAHGGGLASAVRAEQAGDTALLGSQVDARQSARLPLAFWSPSARIAGECDI